MLRGAGVRNNWYYDDGADDEKCKNSGQDQVVEWVSRVPGGITEKNGVDD